MVKQQQWRDLFPALKHIHPLNPEFNWLSSDAIDMLKFTLDRHKHSLLLDLCVSLASLVSSHVSCITEHISVWKALGPSSQLITNVGSLFAPTPPQIRFQHLTTVLFKNIEIQRGLKTCPSSFPCSQYSIIMMRIIIILKISTSNIKTLYRSR